MLEKRKACRELLLVHGTRPHKYTHGACTQVHGARTPPRGKSSTDTRGRGCRGNSPVDCEGQKQKSSTLFKRPTMKETLNYQWQSKQESGGEGGAKSGGCSVHRFQRMPCVVMTLS